MVRALLSQGIVAEAGGVEEAEALGAVEGMTKALPQVGAS